MISASSMIKKAIIFFLLCFSSRASIAQQIKYWQQDLKYNIVVHVDDSLKLLKSNLNLTYKNNSPDTLKSIWFHCWPNAYENDRTAFSEQLLSFGRTDFYFSPESKKGYLNGLTFSISGEPAKCNQDSTNKEWAELILNQPLFPNEELTISTPFQVKLPYHFSRSGYVGSSFQAAQWYPKPAVYDHKGWHKMRYLDQGEFYGEFGSYEISINISDAYEVEATGKLHEKRKEGNRNVWTFKQDQVHDFAWFADKYWVTESDTMMIDGRTIEITGRHYKRELYKGFPMIPFIKSAIRSKSAIVGNYPYDVVKVVESPLANGGGMEYPTITLIDQPSSAKELEDLILHEVGHNWFYGIIGSNEREHPWLDEGMNTYYDNRYFKEKRQNKTADGQKKKMGFIRGLFSTPFEELQLSNTYRFHTDLPISSSSESFSNTGYNLIVYKKAAKWMELMEQQLGKSRFDSMMKTYYQKWAFKHPYPEDFKSVAFDYLGNKTDSLFSLLDRKGPLNGPLIKRKGLTFFNLSASDHKIPFFAIPLLGYNATDKLMVGGIIHNYSIPSARLQFMSLPLFSPKSGRWNGLHRVEYDFFRGNAGSVLKGMISYGRFSNYAFTNTEQKSFFTDFQKTTASIKYQFPKKNTNTTTYRFLEWKQFHIRESNLRFDSDSNGDVTGIRTLYGNRTLQRLTYGYENYRKLYPYSMQIEAEKGKQFARLQLTAKYHFNYADGGGLDVRAFGGKFFYLVDKNIRSGFETERYHLNMTGPNGFEDYAYQDYFIGRNSFDDFNSRQIMERDGYFKVRTDLLSSKIGKNDNWLFAMNFSTTIPDKINILKLLPVKIPLRIFADFGTNGTLIENKSRSQQFLYDAGLEIRLLNETVIFYFPLLYSKPYKEYIQSTIPENKFWKTMSFSIQIRQYTLDKLIAKWL